MTEEISWANTVEFVPIVNGGKVIKVYDCDTITIACKIPYSETIAESNIVYRFHIRLLGIDSPEIKSRDANDKTIAILARDRLSMMILHKNVTLKNKSIDKYGRILANVVTEDGIDLSSWALRERYAVPYNGGAKVRPKDWVIFHELGFRE